MNFDKHCKLRIFLQSSFLVLLLLSVSISAYAAQDSAVTSPSPSVTPSDTLAPESPEALIAGIHLLRERSFSKKAEAIQQLQSVDDPRVIKIFKYLLAGNLYYRKKNRLVVYLDKRGGEFTATDVLSEESLGKIAQRDVKKIIVNNLMRRQLRTAIAQLSLGHRDAAVRLSAVREMLDQPTTEDADLVRVLITKEPDSDVKDAMGTLIALADLNSDDKKIRLVAIEHLNGSLESAAFNKLRNLLQKDDSGSYLEQDKDIIKAANSAIKRIEDKRKFYGILETTFFWFKFRFCLIARSYWPSHNLRRYGRHQHGPWRVNHAGRLHDVHHPTPDAKSDCLLFICRDTSGVRRLRIIWRRHRTRCDSLLVWPPVGDAIGDVWH